MSWSKSHLNVIKRLRIATETTRSTTAATAIAAFLSSQLFTSDRQKLTCISTIEVASSQLLYQIV